MDGILAAVPFAMCVSLRSSCRNRDNAESIYHFPGKSSNRVSVLQTGNNVSSQRCNSLLKKRHCSEISRVIVKSAASSGKAWTFIVVVSEKTKFDLQILADFALEIAIETNKILVLLSCRA